jgi:hypothetical protein
VSGTTWPGGLIVDVVFGGGQPDPPLVRDGTIPPRGMY